MMAAHSCANISLLAPIIDNRIILCFGIYTNVIVDETGSPTYNLAHILQVALVE